MKMLTSTEQKLIEETWQILSADLKGNGANVFLRFFTDYPIHQKSFRSFANVPFDQLRENKRFQAHAFTVMNAIDGLVTNLDDPEILDEMLERTGGNHGRRKITAQAFEEFELSFMGFLETALGKKWTEEVENAWKIVVNVIIAKIKAGLTENE